MNVSVASPSIKVGPVVKMLMNVMDTIAASTAARISLVDTGVAAHKDISSTTNGISVLMKMNATMPTFVEELHATILWEALSAHVPQDFSMSSLPGPAKILMNVDPRRCRAAMAVRTPMVVMSVDVHLTT